MRCAIYCRLSREDEDKLGESESIQNQKQLLSDYVRTQAWDLVDIYSDEDYSGADRSRPEFNRLLRDAKSGRFDLILCKTQSRFTRDMELVERYLHGLFPLWGIRFIALADHVDTDLQGNKKARQINGLVNEWYLEDLSENIRMVFNHKRRQGDYIGGFPLYGYRLHPTEKGRLVVDPEAATVVRQIYQWALLGYGKQKIADKLNEQGISNPSLYKKEHGSAYTNGSLRDPYGRWNRSSVGRILHNEMYLGVMVQGTRKKLSYKSSKLISVPKEKWFRVEGTHEGIIDVETFEAVRALHQSRSKACGDGAPHLLAGLVCCAACGSKLHKNKYQYQGKTHSYLRCTNPSCPLRAMSDRSPCSIRLDLLLSRIELLVKEHLSTWYLPSDPVGRFEFEQARRTTLEQEYTSLSTQYKQRKKALESLYLDKVSGLLSEQQFRLLSQSFTEDLGIYQERMQELEQQVLACKSTSSCTVDQPVQVPLTRPLFTALISKVTIERKRKEDEGQGIHIYWNF